MWFGHDDRPATAEERHVRALVMGTVSVAILSVLAVVSATSGGGQLALPAVTSEPRGSFTVGAADQGHQFVEGSIAYILNARVRVQDANGRTRTVAAPRGIKGLVFLSSNGHLIATRQSGRTRGGPACDLYDLSTSATEPAVTYRVLARQVPGSLDGGCDILGLDDQVAVQFTTGACGSDWFAVDLATRTAKYAFSAAQLSVARDGVRAVWLENRLYCGTQAFVPMVGSLSARKRARPLNVPIPLFESHLGRVRGFSWRAAGPVAISPSGATVAFAERTATDVKLWAGSVAGRLAIIARPASVEAMHWSADGRSVIVVEKSSQRATGGLVSISYPEGRRLRLASISSSAFAVAASAAPKASAARRVAWVLPAIWGDPSPQMARAGLWFKAGRVARDSRTAGVPWRTWAASIDDVGDLFLRFTNMRWRGWGAGRVDVLGYAQLCYAGQPDCRTVDGRPAPRHAVRLVLTRLRDRTCPGEPRTLFYTRYRLVGMPDIASRTNRSDRYC